VNLVGVWRLKAGYSVARGTGDRLDLLGAEPFGYGILDASGRAMAVLTAGGRTPATSGAEGRRDRR